MPALECAPAEVACSGGDSFRVKSCFLVEGNEVGGVCRAEDMPAVLAVMPAEEETERGAAGG